MAPAVPETSKVSTPVVSVKVTLPNEKLPLAVRSPTDVTPLLAVISPPELMAAEKVDEAATEIDEEADKWPATLNELVAEPVPKVKVPIVELEVKSPIPK